MVRAGGEEVGGEGRGEGGKGEGTGGGPEPVTAASSRRASLHRNAAVGCAVGAGALGTDAMGVGAGWL